MSQSIRKMLVEAEKIAEDLTFSADSDHRDTAMAIRLLINSLYEMNLAVEFLENERAL